MEEFIRDWGYIALFLYSFGGGFIGLAIASVLSYSGDLNIYLSILIAGISNFIGGQFLFFLARKNKNYAKDMMRKHGRKIALTHLLMRKYGSFVIFIQIYLWNKNFSTTCNGNYKIFSDKVFNFKCDSRIFMGLCDWICKFYRW